VSGLLIGGKRNRNLDVTTVIEFQPVIVLDNPPTATQGSGRNPVPWLLLRTDD
jgi:hypothetical protein